MKNKLDWIIDFLQVLWIEGCFTCSIIENQEIKTGWRVKPAFELTLHARDRPLLEKIKKTLAVGKIYKTGPQSFQLRVETIKEFARVINHLDKFILITKKRADFDLLKKVFILMKRKEHLTPEGLRKIVALKAAMNLGLSEKLWKAFPGVVPVERSKVELPQTIDPYWLAGFTDGEGCFYVKIKASQTHSVGFQVTLVFVIGQHQRDKNLMILIKEYLNCGYVTKHSDNVVALIVSKFEDILNKIIPFFKKFRICGVKEQDFQDFCKVAEMMKEKKHLTKDGLEQIKKIKAVMNTGRKIS